MNNRNTRCCGFLLNSKNELLLVKHKHIYGNQYWWFPGGGLENGESHEEGIKREILEELNVKIHINQIFYITDNDQIRTYKLYCIGIGYIIEGQTITLENNKKGKLIDYKWFPILQENKYDPILLQEDIYPVIIEAKKYLV